MNKLYIINIYFSVLLIILGIYGLVARYLEMGDWQFTSLIPAVFGLILISMTGGMKRHNRIVSHIVVGLTFLLSLMVSVMLIRNLVADAEIDRKLIIFLIILLSSFITLGFYIASFISARKNKPGTEQPKG